MSKLETGLPQEDLEDLYENAPCGYLSLRPDGRIYKVNQTFSDWVGYEPADLGGRRWLDLLNIAGKIYYETHFAPLLRMQGFFHEVALDLVTKAGAPLPVLVNASERRDAAGQSLFTRITVFNATDRRRYEHALKDAQDRAAKAAADLQQINVDLEHRVRQAVAERLKAEEALRQSQKMEAIGQLTGGVAHDFNNLLTVIIGGVDAIVRQAEKLPQTPEAARIRRSADMALHGARRASALTARLLAFARRQPLAPKIIEPNRLVAGLADLLQRTLGETVVLETVFGPGLWPALADPSELENALVNLCVNARDAMPDGGRLTIETHNACLDATFVALPEPVAPGSYVMVAVSDTGHGMTPEILAQVFEPFFTTKGVGKGTGLGLSQVYGFVRQSGGHIHIESVVGQGTTIRLYMPRACSHASDEIAEAALETVEGGGETILVVEDHDEVRQYSCGVLRELGYHVIEATTGRQALELLHRTDGIALIFTDVVLPDGMDGRALAQEMHRRRKGLKVLFTTGYTHNAIVHGGQLDADVDFLGKPFTYSELANKVRAMLDVA